MSGSFESYPILVRLAREQFERGGCPTLAAWEAEARQGLSALLARRSSARLRKQCEQILAAYAAVDRLLEAVVRASTPVKESG